MVFGWTNSQSSPIAVDFGADTLKLLQVNPTNPPQLIAAASAEIPAAARSDPSLRMSFYADALQSLRKLHPFKGRRAILCLPAYQTLTQNIQILPGEPAEVSAQIEQHLRQRLNIEPTRMVVRHFPVGPVVRDGANKEEIICLAASRDVVMRHLNLAQRAKLDVVGMHCEAVAIVQAFAHLFRRAEDAQRTTCFIDIGAATTKVLIAHGGTLVFAKSIHAAGDHFTRQRAQAANLDFTAAKAARMREAHAARAAHAAQLASTPAPPALTAAAVDVPATTPPRPSGGLAVLDAQLAAAKAPGTTPGNAPPKPTPSGSDANVTSKTGPGAESDGDALDCLIDELQLCVRYHQSIFPQRPVEKLVFLGGEAHQVATCQKIARTLRIGAQLGDPLARLTRVTAGGTPGIDLRQPQPGWAVPLGLCLCEPNL